MGRLWDESCHAHDGEDVNEMIAVEVKLRIPTLVRDLLTPVIGYGLDVFHTHTGRVNEVRALGRISFLSGIYEIQQHPRPARRRARGACRLSYQLWVLPIMER